MLFRVEVDLSRSLDCLSKIGMSEVAKQPYWISVEAGDPDEACYQAKKKVTSTIDRTFSNLSITSSKVQRYTEQAIDNMRIIKIERG